MIGRLILSFPLLLLMVGCTSVQVTPLSATHTFDTMAIEYNPKVKDKDFLLTLREGYDRHGIPSQVIERAQTADHIYVTTYTANRGWDFAPFLKHAEIHVWKKGRLIGKARYHLTFPGRSFSLIKWQSTRTKIDPVMDQLLNQFATPSASSAK